MSQFSGGRRMSIEVVIRINASVGRVWAGLIDVENWPEWTTMKSVARVDGGALAVGSKARMKQPKLGSTVWTVTEFSLGRSFVWEAKRPGLTLVAGHRIDVVGPSAVNLTLSIDQRGPFGRTVARLTRGTVTRLVQLEAEGHKRRSEAPG